jgi:hypothetical protein
MSSSFTLKVCHVSSDFAADIDLINKEIESSGVLENLYEEASLMKWYNGFLKLNANNKILIANQETNSYEEYAETYGAFQKDSADIIAKHTTTGKLVFSQRYEDPTSDDQILIVEPGSARETTIAQYYKTL